MFLYSSIANALIDLSLFKGQAFCEIGAPLYGVADFAGILLFHGKLINDIITPKTATNV